MTAKMKLLNKIKTKFAALLQISLRDWLGVLFREKNRKEIDTTCNQKLYLFNNSMESHDEYI